MSSKLDRLLDEIHPSRNIDVVEANINRAMAGYYRSSNTVSSWEEYQECLAEFVRQARNAVLHAPSGAGHNNDVNFGEALGHLKNDYPGDTLQAVYDIVRTGAEGGIYQILRTIARHMAEEYSQNEITAKVVSYWNSLSVDEKIAAPYEYIKKFSNVLPRQIVEGDNVRFRGFFWKVLEQHPRMLKQVQELGRPYTYRF